MTDVQRPLFVDRRPMIVDRKSLLIRGRRRSTVIEISHPRRAARTSDGDQGEA